jgi:hypothetical protein
MKQLFSLTTGKRFLRSDRTTLLEIGPGMPVDTVDHRP